MAGPTKFSEAEQDAALLIIRRYGEVSSTCGDEVRAKLGRYVSDKTLREWKKKSWKPKKQAQISVDNVPTPANNHEPDVPSTEPDNLADLPADKQLLARLRRSALRIVTKFDDPAQVELLSGLSLFKAAREVATLLREFQSVSEDVVALAPLIRQFVELCEALGAIPEQALGDILAYMGSQLTEQQALAARAQDTLTGELILIEQSEAVSQ